MKLSLVVTLTALVALAAPVDAADHPIGGPRRATPAPAPAQTPADAATPPARSAADVHAHARHAALEVYGVPVSYKTYRRVIRDAEFSWKQLLDMFPVSVLVKPGQTKEEFLFLHEHAEPLFMSTRHASEIPDLKKTAEECYRRARAGEDMSILSLKYSTAADVLSNRGDTGLLGFTDLVHPLNRLAWAAQVGDVLPPVQTVKGYHVLKVIEVVPAHDVPAAEGQPAQHVPELRRFKETLLLWNTARMEEDPGFQNLRREINAIPTVVPIRVLDDRLCAELPNWCAARPAAWHGGIAPASAPSEPAPAEQH